MSYRQEGLKKFKRTKLPFVVAKCAQTIDGKIATVTGNSKWITGTQARVFARKNRDKFDAILVGINTVIKDRPRLNGARRSKILKKVILDASLKISPQARLFKGMPPSSCIIATSKKAPIKKIKSLQRRGIIVIVCPQKGGQINLKWLCKRLAQNGVYSILIEGGATALGSGLKEKLVDELHIYIAPKILGDQTGISSVIGRNIKFIKQTIDVNFIDVKRLGKDVLIISHVHRNS